MKQEQGAQGGPELTLHITKGVEIRVGQTVPVLQHKRCFGNLRTIMSIEPEIRTYQVNCNKCGNSVILDITSLANSGGRA